MGKKSGPQALFGEARPNIHRQNPRFLPGVWLRLAKFVPWLLTRISGLVVSTSLKMMEQTVGWVARSETHRNGIDNDDGEWVSLALDPSYVLIRIVRGSACISCRSRRGKRRYDGSRPRTSHRSSPERRRPGRSRWAAPAPCY